MSHTTQLIKSAFLSPSSFVYGLFTAIVNWHTSLFVFSVILSSGSFVNCVVWDKLAENLAKYQHKGNQIAVEGRIQTRNYDDKDGKKVYVTEIFVSNITFLDSKGSNDSVNNLEEPPVKPGPITTEQIDSMPAANDPFASFGNEVEINDSDLPF